MDRLTGAALQRVSGVLESGELSAELVRGLPSATPGPPWDCRVQAILWAHRAAPGAADAMVPALRGRRTLPVTVGAFVRYLGSPVGPYSEVFASPLLVLDGRRRPSVSVPFIAVDSLPSVRGGREHWALPKVLASFAWTTHDRECSAAGETADGAAWSVHARAVVRGPELPLAGVLPSITPSGTTAMVRQRGRARVAQVHVETAGPSLPSWLLPGRHWGLQIVTARMRVGAPR